MPRPSTLIFVDLPADDPAAAARFYADVFGWRDDPRPEGVYHRMVPGGDFLHPDGRESGIGNLHVGIYKAGNARPHPDPAGVAPRGTDRTGRAPRIWIMVSDDDTPERVLAAAVERGAELLWTRHYWETFNGFNHAFRDPWGNEIVLWVKAGPAPRVPDGFTRE